MPKVTFKAQAHSENPTKTVVRTNGFTVIVDEPKNQGSTNEGPTPWIMFWPRWPAVSTWSAMWSPKNWT